VKNIYVKGRILVLVLLRSSFNPPVHNKYNGGKYKKLALENPKKRQFFSRYKKTVRTQGT
jgi:hypothetical protein